MSTPQPFAPQGPPGRRAHARARAESQRVPTRSYLASARFRGGHRIEVLQGGDELFPAMEAAMAAAEHEIWLATYIFNDDEAGQQMLKALVDAAARGIEVHLLVDGFGTAAQVPWLRQQLAGTAVSLEIFRPLDRWWAWLQPGQLRRMHQKLCAVDERVCFVGGINIIGDRFDQRHGLCETPRLDFAVRVEGPMAEEVQHVVQALWTRAALGHQWREKLAELATRGHRLSRAMALWRDLRLGDAGDGEADPELPPVRAAFVVRDNFRRRHHIERAYVKAIRRAQQHVDIVCPYFYPGQRFRGALKAAARRGVKIRLLLQGKVDYRMAGLAARVMYDELLRYGVHIYEYQAAFLHAKVAIVDDDWATVGSSNIDPMSLLLNLEANVLVRDRDVVAQLQRRVDEAFAASGEITAAPFPRGWRGWLSRGFVAWLATAYLRVAGITGRY